MVGWGARKGKLVAGWKRSAGGRGKRNPKKMFYTTKIKSVSDHHKTPIKRGRGEKGEEGKVIWG